MIRYLYRHNKDYSRYNIIKKLTNNIKTKNSVYILLPFSKNQFIKFFFKRNKIINDFFISNYDTYVYDRQKITKKNPRAWWKYMQDWINFRFSKYLLSDTQAHFEYWEELFGKFTGKHLVLPVLADTSIYYPPKEIKENKKLKVLFYGSFIPLHGIDKILNAFKLLDDENVPLEAEIVGKGQIFKDMSQLHEKLNLKNVVMNGQIIEEKELANKIRNADILLGIFGDSKKAKSVIPNKFYQALACAKPIITMKSDTVNEFFTNQDYLKCDNTPEEIASSIKKLILDKNLRYNIANNGYKTFQKLYEKTKNDFENLIKEVDNA